MKPGLCIGNGESRLAYADSLKGALASGAFLSVACNSAWREFPHVDALICVDDRIRKLWQKEGCTVLPEKRLYRPYEKSGYASGPSAIGWLARQGCTTIVLAGFDCCWTPHEDHRLNNVYKGTPGYSRAESAHQNNVGQVDQIARIMEAFPALELLQSGPLTLHPSTLPKSIKWKGPTLSIVARIGRCDLSSDGTIHRFAGCAR